LFNLKVNQLIDSISELAKMGVSSLKIEGRMKSDEYTYRVAKAYRMVLDSPGSKEEAKDILALDFGRIKPAIFLEKM